jgi:hypothetical protein
MNVIAIIWNMLIFGGLAFWYWRSQTGVFRKVFWPAITVKIFSGFLIGWIYLYYYQGGDTFQYFEDGVHLSKLALSQFGDYLRFLWNGDYPPILQSLHYSDERAIFFDKLTSVINIITDDNYWLTACWCSIVSFSASWYLVKVCIRHFPEYTVAAIVAFLFFPTVVFWTSGLMKESIACAALFFLSALFLQTWFRSSLNIWQILLTMISLWLLWQLKYYYAAIFVPTILSCAIVRALLRYNAIRHSRLLQTAIWLIVFFGLLSIVSVAHPNFSYREFFQVIVANYELYNGTEGTSDIHYATLTPTLGSFMLNAPWALCSGLFRPFLWESHNLLQIGAAFENLFLVLLFVFCLRNVFRMFKNQHYPLFVACAVYIVILCILLALSTPNFGTLSRYRVGFLPYFVFIILLNNPLITSLERSLHRLVR